MISVTCPQCSSSFNFEESQAGLAFHCTQCGKNMDIPRPGATSPIVPSRPESPSGAPQSSWPSNSAPSPPPQTPASNYPLTAPPEQTGSAGATLVRCHFGEFSKKINTHRSLAEVRGVVDRVLYDYGLDVEEDGEVFGEIKHSYSSFLKTKVTGEIIVHSQKNEVVIDLECRNSVTGTAILLAILCWPLLIVGAIVLPNMGKDEFHKEMKSAVRSIEKKLK